MKNFPTRGLLLSLALSSGSFSLAQPLLSLIEGDSREAGDINRLNAFVEIRDVGGREKEYSVPFLPIQSIKKYTTNSQANWKKYQDTMHWSAMMGLNRAIDQTFAPPTDTFLYTCMIPLASLQISLTHTITGKTWIDAAKEPDDLNISDVSSGGSWKSDNMTLENVWAPRVKTNTYCPNSNLKVVPDYLFPGSPTNMYEPARIETVYGAPVFTSGTYPAPAYVNWPEIAKRTQEAANKAHKKEYPDYQKAQAQALATFLPTSIHWDGAMNLLSGGQRSGTSMAPYFDIDPTKRLKTIADISASNAQFPIYIQGGLALGDPSDKSDAETAPGLKSLEALKRQLPAGPILQQEREGSATFLQTWQQLDTVTDYRPLNYWIKSLVCNTTIFPPSRVCIPTPFAVPIAPMVVTTPGAVVPPAPGTGSTVFTLHRYRYGNVTIPEGHYIPNTYNKPVLRVGEN